MQFFEQEIETTDDIDIQDVIVSICLARKGITLGEGTSIQKIKEKGRR